ncbi:transglycosylase domain-containing protein, partial [Vibrio cholerae O1]|nr:transglycosylase domain-containing protein [Vibrio cholerae O1]
HGHPFEHFITRGFGTLRPTIRAKTAGRLRQNRQLWRALQLEWHLSKREILTLYLNRAPFGGTLQGIGA